MIKDSQAKRYLKIDKHLAQYFVYSVESLSSSLPIQSNNYPFTFQWSPSIREKGWNFSKLLKPYSCSSVEFLLPGYYVCPNYLPFLHLICTNFLQWCRKCTFGRNSYFIWCKFSIIIWILCARTALSKDAIWDESSWAILAL